MRKQFMMNDQEVSESLKADMIRKNTNLLVDEGAGPETKRCARNTLITLFPFTGYMLWRHNAMYGIPEMQNRVNYRDLEQEVYLSLLENMIKFDPTQLLGLTDKETIARFVAYMNKWADGAVKRYIEKENHISHYYARMVLHMWKYHNHMTIQGSTDKEIYEAIGDADKRAKPRMATVLRLRQWSNRQLCQTKNAGSYTMDLSDSEEMKTELYTSLMDALSSDQEREIFQMIYLDQMKVDDVIEKTGVTPGKIAGIKKKIKKAAAQFAPEMLRRYTKAQPFLNAGLAAC